MSAALEACELESSSRLNHDRRIVLLVDIYCSPVDLAVPILRRGVSAPKKPFPHNP
eukprot:COSAG02_NODE_43707_length_372_cov_0.941392_1_plen_55_part_01